MKYNIEIILESDMCMGNGEGRGNTVDRDICVNNYGIPYIPARRIKGCLRQTAVFLMNGGYDKATQENITTLFGDKFGNEGILILEDAHIEDNDEIVEAIDKIRESNQAYLREVINPENMRKSFTAVRGQTRLKDGVKVDNTLRFTRVVTKNNSIFNQDKPVSFKCIATIKEENKNIEEFFEATCKGTRHIGSGRNRGLGNVRIICTPIIENASNDIFPRTTVDVDKLYTLEYKISLDAPIAINGCKLNETVIPSRSLIGCLGGNYNNLRTLRNSFDDLFLNGAVKWSDLTPVIDGRISYPTPMFLLKLKNGGGRLINQYAEEGTEWKKLKPKTIEDSFCVETEDGFAVADIITQAQYHNNIKDKKLYIQEAIDAGYIYGGTVTFKGKYYEDIVELLTKTTLRFGRSKNIQYANTHIVELSNPREKVKETRIISGNIYVVLLSDLILNINGCYITDNEDIRQYIVKSMDFSQNEIHLPDCIRYGMVGGFQNMWHLQKMKVPTIKGGSVFCFNIAEASVPYQVQLGSYKQEGFGNIRIYSEEELLKLNVIKSEFVDKLHFKVNEDTIKEIQLSLTTYVIKETLLKYANSYPGLKDGVPVSRLRLMAEKSNNYKDLMERVETIKESDVSSENTGRKDKAKKFLKDFYGEGKIDWNKLLQSSPGLYEAVKNDERLNSQINSMWKIPLMQTLHNAHYKKGGR